MEKSDGAVEQALPDDTEPLPEAVVAVFSAMDDGIIIQTPSERFLFANAAAARLMGFPSSEVLVSTPPLEMAKRFEILDEHGNLLAHEQLPTKLALRGQRPPATEIRFRVPETGEERWALLSSTPLLDPQGRVRWVINAFRDFTAQKRRAELALAERAAALASSKLELEQFAYAASHDLQEPLRMISGFTQLLARRYQGKLDSAAGELIAFAVDGANRMQILINDLLTYSRISTRGKEPSRTDCGAVLQNVLASLEPAVDESGAQITFDPLPTVMVDTRQLEQLFWHLLGNALKFRRDVPPRIHVSAQRQEGDWLFSVRDNGIGLEPKHADRIFVIFQRLHGRNDYKGTGVGLALCKKIVERHGGRIWVEPILGQGSTFFFTLPAHGTRGQS